MEYVPAQRATEHGIALQVDDIRQRLSSAIQMIDQFAEGPAAQTTSRSVSESEVRALLKQRRQRGRFFDPELFADPAWDILLELFAAQLGQQRVCVTSLCVGAAVPTTTALRWIKCLEEKGLIERKPDPMDGRRFFLALSSTGLAAMCDFFRTVPAGAPLI